MLTFFWAAITTRACGWGLDARDVRYRQFRACDRSTRGSPGSRANRGAQSFSGYDGCPRGKNRGGGAAGGGWTHRTGGLGGRLGGDTHAGGEGNVEGDGVHRVRVSLNGSRGRDDVRGERAGSRVWQAGRAARMALTNQNPAGIYGLGQNRFSLSRASPSPPSHLTHQRADHRANGTHERRILNLRRLLHHLDQPRRTGLVEFPGFCLRVEVHVR